MSRVKRNWKDYNRSLINRGSLTLWIDEEIQSEWMSKGKLGRPKFRDHVIKIGLMLRAVYRLSYRSLQGFFSSILKLMKLTHRVPHYSLFSKRAGEIELPKLSHRKPLDLVIDSSGLKIYGEGEWKVKVHGASHRRKWIKAHIALDPSSQEVMAIEVTENSIHDAKVLPHLVESSPKSVKRVLADGAYSGRSCRSFLYEKGIEALIPPALNSRLGSGIEYEAKNDALRIIKGLGGDDIAKSLWKRFTGYYKRSLVETAFSRLKRLFGDRLQNRKMFNQEVEAYVRCLALNRMRAA